MIGYALVPQLWAHTNGPVQAPLPNDRLVVLPLNYTQLHEDAKRTYEGGTLRGYETAFLLAALVVVPATIWAADLFTRFVDEPVVRFARRVEMCVGPEEN
jgi:hypothetical protein